MVCLLCGNNSLETDNVKKEKRKYLKLGEPICDVCYIDFLEFVLDRSEVIPIDIELVYMNFFGEGRSWHDCVLCPENAQKRKYLEDRTGWCDGHYTLFLENLMEFINVLSDPTDQNSSFEYYKIKLTPQSSPSSAKIKKKSKNRKKRMKM